ncbi:MAG: class I SAM-dependent methyltransferase, partial [Bacteroidota bacterium]
FKGILTQNGRDLGHLNDTFAAMSRIWTIREALSFYSAADTLYQVHSPFVFELAKKVLEDDRWYYAFGELEAFRALLQQKKDVIEVTDYGAGSQKMPGKKRSTQEIARSSLSGAEQCRQLFRLVQHFRPKRILELGTSLGISTLYMRAADTRAHILTLEGCPQIAKLARGYFKSRKADNIELIEGRFADTLPQALAQLGAPDLVFIDGHHLKAPTLAYFEQCLAASHENTVFVFDDVHWSAEMVDAWTAIRSHPSIRLTVDLFRMGLAFQRPEQREREHFRLVPKYWKPWKIM